VIQGSAHFVNDRGADSFGPRVEVSFDASSVVLQQHLPRSGNMARVSRTTELKACLGRSLARTARSTV
jgi:hypothetical protein